MKKDINYVQALEKAVKEKYGDLAASNPQTYWSEDKEKLFLEEQKEFARKTYLADISNEKVELDGILISKRLINTTKRTCKYCKKYSFDKKDDLYINKFEACYRCYVCEIEDKN